MDIVWVYASAGWLAGIPRPKYTVLLPPEDPTVMRVLVEVDVRAVPVYVPCVLGFHRVLATPKVLLVALDQSLPDIQIYDGTVPLSVSVIRLFVGTFAEGFTEPKFTALALSDMSQVAVTVITPDFMEFAEVGVVAESVTITLDCRVLPTRLELAVKVKVFVVDATPV